MNSSGNNKNRNLCEPSVSSFGRGFLPRISLLLVAAITPTAFCQTLTTLHSFGATASDGQAPAPGVVIDRDGNVFGATGTGGKQGFGTLFKLSPPKTPGGSWTETILHQFRGLPDGKDPLSRPAINSNGRLFGTTLRGGAHDLGTIYTFKPDDPADLATEENTSEKAGRGGIIHNFGSFANDVVTPDLGLLVASEGLYGADQGGANNSGAVYLLRPPNNGSPWTETILYSFQAFQSGDAAFPSGELVRDSAGNLYGVTAQGGANNLGAVYEVSPPTEPGAPWTEKVVFSFNGTDGTLPAGRLLLGGQGQLYGTTNGGGASGAGTVFELFPPRLAGTLWTHRIIYAFTGGADGTSPGNGVITDGKGRLFGAAADVIFMLTFNTSEGRWEETVLHTFTGPDGFSAVTPLTLFRNALYGTTLQAGGFGAGTVFQLALP